MSLKYLVPSISLLLVACIAFSLQAHAPSMADFLKWFGVVGFLISVIELIVGLLLWVGKKTGAGKVWLISGSLLLLISGVGYTVSSLGYLSHL